MRSGRCGRETFGKQPQGKRRGEYLVIKQKQFPSIRTGKMNRKEGNVAAKLQSLRVHSQSEKENDRAWNEKGLSQVVGNKDFFNSNKDIRFTITINRVPLVQYSMKHAWVTFFCFSACLQGNLSYPDTVENPCYKLTLICSQVQANTWQLKNPTAMRHNRVN